jgi:ribosomal protein S18 acetylase RimI-like enzyme
MPRHAPEAAAPPRLAAPRPPAPLEVELVRFQELHGVVDVINEDQLPGQPACGRHGLDRAMRGESAIDSGWWSALSDVRVVAARRGGVLLGAASYAISPTDKSGWLLWLHAREAKPVVEALVDHVLEELSGSSHLYAFWIATALTLGIEALPVEHRQVTHEILTARGLAGRESWRYLVLSMERAVLDGGGDDVASVQSISNPGDTPTWRLVVGDRDQPVASAEVALGPEGRGMLSWVEVEPAHRGRGIGRRLLRQTLRFLALRGAETVAAVVDSADPRDRDPRPVLHLLASAGFQEVDRLWAYESAHKKR